MAGPQLEPWQTGAPVAGPAAPPADASLADAPTGAYRNAKYPEVVHNADGSIYGIGHFGAGGAQQNPDGSVEISLSGTTAPEEIANLVRRHPDVLPPPASAQGQAPADAAGAPATDGGDWRSGTPVTSSAQDHAATDAQAEVAQTLPDDTSKGVWKALQGATYGFGDEAAAGLDALKVGGANLLGRGPGYGMGDAYSAKMDAIHGAEAGFDKSHPLLGIGLEAAGSMANPLSYLGGGFIKGGEGLGSVVGRSMAVGAGQGALFGAGNANGDIGSRVSGAIEGAKWGGLTGGAIPVIGAGVGAVARPFMPQASRTAAAGMASANDALSRLGLNLNSFPAEALARVKAAAAQGMNGGDAAIQEAGRSLPVPVPMSRGQISGEPGQQLAENMILRGARGEPPQRLAKMFQLEQQQALRGNVDQIGADMTGGFPTYRGQAGASVSDALNMARDRAWRGVDVAYDAARGATEPAYLAPPNALRFVQAAKQGMADFDPLNVPRVAREVNRLTDVAAPWAKDLPEGVNPARISQVSGAKPADIRSLFEARTRISHLRESNGVEAAAATSVLRHFDQAMGDALTNDLFHGDPATVDLWRKAIGARADFGKTFEANDLVQKLTAREGGGGSSQLKVDPHDASNYIFGRSNLGFVGRQNLYRGLTRLRGVLGSSSDAWNRVRGEAFARIAGAGEGPMELGSAQFSGAKFAQAWAKAKNEDPKLVESLFADHERTTIDRFAAVAARVTKPVTGGDNPSNTAVAMGHVLRAVKRLPFLAMESLPLIDHLADKIDHAAAARSIRAATFNAAPRRVTPLPSAVFAGGLNAPARATAVLGLGSKRGSQ